MQSTLLFHQACVVKVVADSLLYFFGFKKAYDTFMQSEPCLCGRNAVEHAKPNRKRKRKQKQDRVRSHSDTQHNTTQSHPVSRVTPTRPPISIITVESARRVSGGGDSHRKTLTGAEPGLVKVPDTDAIIRAIIHSKVNRRLTFNIIDLAE